MAGRPLRRARIALNNGASREIGKRSQLALAEAKESLEQSIASLEDRSSWDKDAVMTGSDLSDLIHAEKRILAAILAWERIVYIRNL